MKASELRIGNWVLNNWLDEQSEHYQVKHGYEIDEAIHQYEPIPLTEEWLLKFGFQSLSAFNLDFGFPNNVDHVISKDGEIGWYYGFENYQVHIPSVDIKYVHQLQNLYFALTGNELAIR